MKHGDKAKAKSAKASSKTSGKKSSKAAGEKSSKAVKTGSKDSSKKAGAEKAAAEKASLKAGAGKGAAVTKSSGGTKAPPAPTVKGGKANGRAVESDGPNFSNALVASAFKRAIKKYPNAFRRLTD